MKTIGQIAEEVRNGMDWHVRRLDYFEFATKLIEAWQAQQEPVGYVGKHIAHAIHGGSAGLTTITQHMAFDDDVAIYLATPPAKMPRFNCFAIDNGCEQWFDCPDDAEILQELDVERVGQEFELIAGWRSGRAKYRVTKVPDETSDDFDVECISHPEENVTPPAIPEGMDVLGRNMVWTSISTPPDMLMTEYGWLRSERVLGITKHGKMQVVIYEQVDDDCVPRWKTDCSEGWDVTPELTHWMNLPQPPAQGGKE